MDMKWKRTSTEYSQVLHELENDILPPLLSALKLHLDTPNESFLCNLLAGVVHLTRALQKPNKELIDLIHEAILRHP